ncbi:MAG: HEPN domain-containing protein [Nanoarchaeota archaeon]
MVDSIIDEFYKRHLELLHYLEEKEEPSLRSEADNNFKKVLVIAIASYFEQQILDILNKFVETKIKDGRLVFFSKFKGINRQYYTYFDFDTDKNANRFFKIFGDEFKKQAEDDVKSTPELEQGIKSFLEIGLTRDRLIHQNFATFFLEKTSVEIYELYKSALFFVDYLKNKLC